MSILSFIKPELLILYSLGFSAFLITILEHWLNPKKRMLSFLWYLEEFIYTLLSIALSIAICFAFDLNLNHVKIAVIMSGLVGSSILRKIRGQKNSIANDVVKKARKKVNSKLE